jgi:hypothetical protein
MLKSEDVSQLATVAQVPVIAIIGLSVSFVGAIIGTLWAGPITGLILPIGLALLWLAQQRLSHIISKQPANGI